MSSQSPTYAAPPSDLRVQRVIRQLKLQAHPEGGWYGEVFRSDAQVTPGDGRTRRAALTSIHFLLPAGHHSRWHRVLSDEVWIHLDGAPLDLWTWQPTDTDACRTRLGRLAFEEDERLRHADAPAAMHAQHVVPAGRWQAARPVEDSAQPFSLVACVVGPGFDFSDFSMMDADSAEARQMAAQHPELARFI